MRIQPEMTKTHEINRTKLRGERQSEEQRLTALRAQLQKRLSQRLSLFATHPNGRVNAA
jgi:hypothetical protein